jgi:hypothetical protein
LSTIETLTGHIYHPRDLACARPLFIGPTLKQRRKKHHTAK